MSSIFATVISAVLQSKRTCSKCGNSQIVPKEKRNEIVICKTCGAEIPPPRK